MGIKASAVVGNGLGEHGCSSHFADHVQVVIAGRTVGTDTDIDTG